MKIIVRPMAIDDYEQVYLLWKDIHGLGIRSIDDSKQGTERFLKRNPTTSIVAEKDGHIIGAILCGHDGRMGTFYHVCVHRDYRQQGIGTKMATEAMHALQREQVTKVNLIAFRDNKVGNQFWKKVGWNTRDDVNYYDFVLNKENIIRFNE